MPILLISGTRNHSPRLRQHKKLPPQKCMNKLPVQSGTNSHSSYNIICFLIQWFVRVQIFTKHPRTATPRPTIYSSCTRLEKFYISSTPNGPNGQSKFSLRSQCQKTILDMWTMTVFISDDCIISSMNPRALAKHGTAGTTRCFTLAGTSERRSFQINASVFVSARLAMIPGIPCVILSSLKSVFFFWKPFVITEYTTCASFLASLPASST